MLWFDVSCIGRNAPINTIGIVYRHQGSTNIPSFTSRMENILNKLNHERANFYIFVDYNINLIKTDDVHNISEFVNSMYSHSAVNLVNKPTRFPIGAQIGRPSLLDHLWTNMPFYVNKIDLIITPFLTIDPCSV